MTNLVEETPKKFVRINAVDVLQGIALCIMFVQHSFLWWDYDAFLEQMNSLFIIAAYAGAFVAPTFLLLMGFNMRDSIARRMSTTSFSEVRKYLLKRVVVFLALGFLNNVLMTVVTFTLGLIDFLTWLFTWDLLHLFGITSLFLYCIYEIAHQLNTRTLLNASIGTQLTILCSFALIIILLFMLILQALYLGDFSFSVLYPERVPVFRPNNIVETIQIALVRGGYAIFPYTSFGVVGFLVANISLSLSNKKSWEKAIVGIIVIFTVIGGSLFVFLRIPIVFPLILHMPSLSFLFLYWATQLVVFFVALLVFDVLKEKRVLLPYVKPLTRMSAITLTIYYTHFTLYSFINPSLVPNSLVLFILIALFILLYMLIAYEWEKKKFKYSLEWIIRKLTT
ncbi:MAG: hypothetical protein ACFFCZ_10345 [Promethearchaeota archaeon]